MNTRVLLGITEVLWGNEWSSVIVAEPLGQGVWRLKLRSYRTAGEPLKRLLVKFFPRVANGAVRGVRYLNVRSTDRAWGARRQVAIRSRMTGRLPETLHSLPRPLRDSLWPTDKRLFERHEVIRAVASVEDCKGDDVKLCGTLEQLLPVDAGNLVGGI